MSSARGPQSESARSSELDRELARLTRAIEEKLGQLDGVVEAFAHFVAPGGGRLLSAGAGARGAVSRRRRETLALAEAAAVSGRGLRFRSARNAPDGGGMQWRAHMIQPLRLRGQLVGVVSMAANRPLPADAAEAGALRQIFESTVKQYLVCIADGAVPTFSAPAPWSHGVRAAMGAVRGSIAQGAVPDTEGLLGQILKHAAAVVDAAVGYAIRVPGGASSAPTPPGRFDVAAAVQRGSPAGTARVTITRFAEVLPLVARCDEPLLYQSDAPSGGPVVPHFFALPLQVDRERAVLLLAGRRGGFPAIVIPALQALVEFALVAWESAVAPTGGRAAPTVSVRRSPLAAPPPPEPKAARAAPPTEAATPPAPPEPLPPRAPAPTAAQATPGPRAPHLDDAPTVPGSSPALARIRLRSVRVGGAIEAMATTPDASTPAAEPDDAATPSPSIAEPLPSGAEPTIPAPASPVPRAPAWDAGSRQVIHHTPAIETSPTPRRPRIEATHTVLQPNFGHLLAERLARESAAPEALPSTVETCPATTRQQPLSDAPTHAWDPVGTAVQAMRFDAGEVVTPPPPGRLDRVVLILDLDGQVRRLNRAARQSLGHLVGTWYEAGDVLDLSTLPAELDYLRTAIDMANRGDFVCFDAPIALDGRTDRRWTLSVAPVRSRHGAVVGTCLTAVPADAAPDSGTGPVHHVA